MKLVWTAKKKGGGRGREGGEAETSAWTGPDGPRKGEKAEDGRQEGVLEREAKRAR